ncbi:glycosyl transferase family 2 [Leucobacter luti]|uniref:glycosyltransferase family 2 protein n=1 Tax=Leucobacter luti TaxID=340320 RepID=UPI001052886A|nr:glycosyltransferase family A protein [Leucobacter luti]MCW2289848.1 glycosyltransferase involved in cell wall biosynthesis [Leucobacter luti]TCK36017.1 glycosyl transferase family 2 [Leucobacter luti]
MNRAQGVLRGIYARLTGPRAAAALTAAGVLFAVVTWLLGAAVLSIAALMLTLLWAGLAARRVAQRRAHRVREEAKVVAESVLPRRSVAAVDLQTYSEILRRQPWPLFRLGARYRSSAVLDQLALRGTRGELRWNGLLARLTSCDAQPIPGTWWTREVLAAALLACMLSDQEDHLRAAQGAIRLALDRGERSSMHEQPQLSWMLQVAVATQDRELCERLTEFEQTYPEAFWAARLDLARPAELESHDTTIPVSALSEWWQTFNELTRRSGLEMWELGTGPQIDTDNLFAAISAPIVDPVPGSDHHAALVSIVVPTYNPGSGFARTIESLTRQSWRNLEILIVDDASSVGTESIAAVAETDPRIQVIRLEKNGGAYRARNAGLQAARGEFVTVLDSDDLAHPRRIERQLVPFADAADVLATVARAIRVRSDGRVTVLGFTPERMNTSSLMFRRERVISRIGLYDEVRKAGDTEYLERMQIAFEGERVVEVPGHLGLTQLTAGSLSRGDFRPGNWHSGDRVGYRNQFRAWHRDAMKRDAVSELRIEPAGSRPFVAPASITGSTQRGQYKIAVVRDWAKGIERFDDWAGAVFHMAECTGDVVGLLNAAGLRSSSHKHTSVRRAVWQTVETGAAEWMSWEPSSKVETLIVTDPEYLLALPDASERGVTAERVIVMVETLVNLPDRAVAVIDPSWVEAESLRAFGVRPEWAFGSLELAQRVLGSAADSHVAIARRAARPDFVPAMRRSKPVIGLVHAGISDRDGILLSWLRERMPAGTELLSEGSQCSAEDVLRSADVLLIDPFDRRAYMRHDLVWTALNGGIPVVGPPRYAEVYGAAVIGTEAEHLQSTLETVATAPESIARQRAAAREFIATHSIEKLLS